jgi:Protein of unknown function (DUF1573)
VRRPGAAVAAALLLAAAAWARDPPPAPRIRVEPESFDFGNVLPDRTLRKEFTIRNFGNAPLELEKVSTTCGCTAALAGTKRVEPGGSTPLQVTFQTRRFSGKVERRVLVRSNDPETPLLEVKVGATVGEGTAKK